MTTTESPANWAEPANPEIEAAPLANNRTAEDFDKMWDAPNTLRIKRQTMAIQRGPDGGLRIILRHGGDTLAMEFDLADTDKLWKALG